MSLLCGEPGYFNMDKAREAGAGSWTCSPEAAVHDLGFRVAASLRDRMDQTVRWYRENGSLMARPVTRHARLQSGQATG